MLAIKFSSLTSFLILQKLKRVKKKKKKSGLVHSKIAHDKPGSELIIH